jgi:hypothetical protein
MNTSEFITTQVSPALQPLAAMGLLLERLERLPRNATATQYRDVVIKIQSLLGAAAPGFALDALLGALPATAELYENLHYAQAGLCRSRQDAAVEAELAVRALLAKQGATGRPG